jgi:hypothetical protein
MPFTSKRQAQLKETQAARQNGKRAQQNIRERAAEHEANIRERAAEHEAEHARHEPEAPHPDCYECLFPRAVHFSLRDWNPLIPLDRFPVCLPGVAPPTTLKPGPSE